MIAEKSAERRALCLAAACTVLLAACSAGGRTALPATYGTYDTAATAGGAEGKLIIRIVIPKHEKKRGEHPSYVSSSTKGMTIRFMGPSHFKETFDLDVSAKRLPEGCKHVASGYACTEDVSLESCPSKADCYKASVATFDAVSCTQSGCTIPPGAYKLSTDHDLSFSMGPGKSALKFALDGIPRSVILMPLPDHSPVLIETSPTAFTIPKCVTTPQSVSVLGVDADGNDIVGSGAPAPRLSSNDRTHLAVATPPPGSNTFDLVPPATLQSATIPNAGTVVLLNASETPVQGSGTPKRARAQIAITFNDAICGVISEYPVPTASSRLSGIVAGPDGALWFTEQQGNKVGRITTNGTITGEVPVPTSSSFPTLIAVGSDGAMWFTEEQGNNIGRITTGGLITNEYPVPTAHSAPFGIVSGPDGAIWFAEALGNKIGQMTTAGVVTNEFPVPTTKSFPALVTVGPDGALWFTENAANKIGRVTTGGAFTETVSGAGPVDITAGPDGAMWFTENANTANEIGRITTGGTITQTTIPTSDSSPAGIAQGPDGALWFAEVAGNKIGRIVTDGTLNEYPIPTSNSNPIDITPGPDGALWFTESMGNNIGRLQ